jgi:hypothetical protein
MPERIDDILHKSIPSVMTTLQPLKLYLFCFLTHTYCEMYTTKTQLNELSSTELSQLLTTIAPLELFAI